MQKHRLSHNSAADQSPPVMCCYGPTLVSGCDQVTPTAELQSIHY